MNITKKRFIECLKNWNFLIKKGDFKITLENYWNQDNRTAMFFNFENKDKKEYVKIYLSDYKPLRINIYLYARGELLETNKGQKEYRDLLIRTFSDFNDFKEFFINIGDIKFSKLNNNGDGIPPKPKDLGILPNFI